MYSVSSVMCDALKFLHDVSIRFHAMSISIHVALMCGL